MAVRRIVQTDTDQQTQSARNVYSRTVDVAAGRTVDRNRRTIRSRELIEAVQSLDTTSDPATAQAVMRWINDEYESRQGGQIVGLFSRCYLGAPYVDHRLDLGGSCIIEHYTRVQTPPGAFQAARALARNNAYIFIEVYDDGSVIPIREDGRSII